ncbi:uncharacterized protein LOC119273533 [Triticum dicoccoides]|uniref:uncharacterized protein LOC119273533 n=1 Tax=Triticum dicoccoides TaxID=85692 RepID=UPI00188F8546|nr:uncharacterized protein LOC119273533 [Triticum dicoccoides]
MKKVTVVAALLLFLPFVVKAKDGNVAGWKPNETPETPESDLTVPPFVFNVSEINEPVRLTLDVAARGGYTAFMTELHRRLKATANGWTIKERPVLGVQRLKWQPPDTWIYVDLKWGGVMPTLAIRADNLYLVGFQLNGGPWYVFKNTFWWVRPLLPGSIPLTFNDSYKSLTRRPRLQRPGQCGRRPATSLGSSEKPNMVHAGRPHHHH